MKKNIILKLINSIQETGFLFTFTRIKRKIKTIKFNRPYKKAYLLTDEEYLQQTKYCFPKKITISVLVPLYNTPINFLEEMIQSVIKQTYSNWELCLADGSDEEHKEVQAICETYCSKEPRIKYEKLAENKGISENTNYCINIATGEYIALFDHDDVLHYSAFYEVMKVICEENADYIYTDEIVFSKRYSKVTSIHFKPAFAIDNLRANNYICHLSVFKKSLLDQTGGFREEFDGSQDHDLILRLTEKAENIVHIPKILYFWRAHSGSVASDISAKTYAVEAGRKAVKSHLERCKLKAKVENSKVFPAIYHIDYKLVANPLVSIIIYKDNKEIEDCIKYIKDISTYNNYEIIVVKNAETINVKNEIKKASGDYYLFCSSNIKLITADWIEKFLQYAQRKDIGAVGAKLYYTNNKIYHAGITLDKENGILYPYQGYSRKECGYMGKLCYAQNFSIISGKCLLVKRNKYEEVGGLDETFVLEECYYDLCIKLVKKGYLGVFQPDVECYYYGSPKEKINGKETKFYNKWMIQEQVEDPYYTKNVVV